MSKLQEKIDLYTSEVEKLELGVDLELLAAVTKGLGPSIYKDDAEKVSSSDKKELETVKKNFLIKKLGLKDSPELDASIEVVIEKIGKSNRNKYRAIFYSLLVEELGMQAIYAEDEEKIVAKAKESVKEVLIDEGEEDEVVIEEEEEEEVSPEEFLENFNWHKYEQGIEEVEEGKLKAFEEALVGTVGFVTEREVIEGTIVRKTEREVIIDINSKSEGVISLNEFRYNPALAVGDTVEVLVDKREDATGQLVLSHKKARVIKAWDRVIAAQESGEVVTGFVKCRTRGGMIVDVFGIEAFLPGSQIDVKPIRDYDQYVEKTM
jgi:small subunit ribosomal protein S1